MTGTAPISGRQTAAGLAFITIVLFSGVGLVMLSGITPQPPEWLTRISIFEHRPLPAVWLAAAGLALAFWIAAFLVRRLAPDADMTLLLAALLLSAMGVILLLRLSPAMAAHTGKPGFAAMVWQQSAYLILSLATMIAVILGLTPAVMARLARRVYIYALLGALLIIITGLFGREINDRRLWLPIGPFSFQTVELVKVLAVLFAAGYFAERRAFMTAEPAGRPARFAHPHVIGPFAVTLLFFLLPIVFQGDLGPALLLSFIMLLMYLAGGGSPVMAALGIACMAGAGWLSCHLHWPTIVRTRFDMWIDPFYFSEVLSRARWAVSSGGWLGAGLGEGMAARIPVVQSDLIFILICEEWGLVGALCVIGLYVVMLHRGFVIARSRETAYAMLMAAGLTGLLGIQTLIIIGGNIGLLPLTGITLPFISHGGSSLLVSFAILGALLNFSQKQKKQKGDAHA